MNLNKAYATCAELPLYNFIKLQVTGDLKYLIKRGTPGNLDAVWDAIISEYASITNDSQQNFILYCLKDITVLTNKLLLVEAIVGHLNKQHHKGLAEQLKSMGFRFKYDPQSKDYQKELTLTISQSKSLVLKLEQRKRDFEILKEKATITENDYDLLLSELSKFQGYPINKMTTTVSEYLAILKRFKDANKPKN